MSERRLFNTLWIVVPIVMAAAMSARGGTVQVVARGLPMSPVTLATDQRPASADGFGVALKVFKIIRQGISITSQLTANMLFPVLNIPSGAFEEMSFGRSTFTVTTS